MVVPFYVFLGKKVKGARELCNCLKTATTQQLCGFGTIVHRERSAMSVMKSRGRIVCIRAFSTVEACNRPCSKLVNKTIRMT